MQGYFPLTSLFNIVQKVLTSEWRQKKKKGNKRYTNIEGGSKTVFVYKLLNCLENFEESITLTMLSDWLIDWLYSWCSGDLLTGETLYILRLANS